MANETVFQFPKQSDMPANRFPTVQISIQGGEDVNLNIPPDYVVELSHEIHAIGAGNRLSLTMFDPSWNILDLFLQKARATIGGHLKVRYSYGFHDMMSDVFLCGILKVVPGQLTVTGVQFSLEGADDGVVEALYGRTTQNQNTRVYSGRISSIVQAIAVSHGWIPDILDTDPVYEYTGVAGGQERVWVKGTMTDLEFIRFLSQFARNTTIPGRFHVRLVTNEAGMSTLYFKPPEQRNSLYATYKIMHDRMGSVISFDPSLDTLNTISLGGAGLEAVGRNLSTREVSQYQVNSVNHQNSMFLGSRAIIPPGNVTRYIMEGTQPEALRNTIESYYAYLANFVQKANMTIMGDKDIRPNDLISVLVLTPRGERYYTSGTWRVNKVKNEVKGGSFLTTLELNRNATDVGNVQPTGPQLQTPSTR